jgi:IS1 family transposase
MRKSLIMNTLDTARRVQVLKALVEGTSVNATVRITGVAKHTILKLLKSLGCACAEYHNRAVRDVKVKRVQCDEIWAFCYAKEKNVPFERRGQFGYGDVWTWTAMDAETKLILSYAIGTRGMETARVFMKDLSSRVATRIQLTTDGHRVYADAVEGAFGCEIDYAMLVKLFGNDPREDETRYSPATCIGCRTAVLSGRPDPKHVSTSFVERQNLTMRMGMRRFTRLTNGFSKKIENHGHAVALHFMYYNFCRVHKTLRVTPAMEAGIADHIWSIEEIVALLDSSHATKAA